MIARRGRGARASPSVHPDADGRPLLRGGRRPRFDRRPHSLE